MKYVLWLEDDEGLDDLLRPLRKLGMVIVERVIDYPSFEGRLKRKGSDYYDLFILDLVVPQKAKGEYLYADEYVHMSGLEMLKKVDRYDRPIIILTGAEKSDFMRKITGMRNVKKVFVKGDIYPSDFSGVVMDLLWPKQG